MTYRASDLDVDQGHFKNQGRIGRNHATSAPRPVAKFRRDGQFAFAAHLHALHPEIPTGNHVTLAKGKNKRIVAIMAGIKTGAIDQPARVMHHHHIADGSLLAFAKLQILNHQTCIVLLFHHSYSIFHLNNLPEWQRRALLPSALHSPGKTLTPLTLLTLLTHSFCGRQRSGKSLFLQERGTPRSVRTDLINATAGVASLTEVSTKSAQSQHKVGPAHRFTHEAQGSNRRRRAASTTTASATYDKLEKTNGGVSMDIRALIAPVIQDRESLDTFYEALTDHAANIENDFAKLKKHPDDKALIADLFRAVHNIKGDAALCRLDYAVTIAHPIESVLAKMRQGSIVLTDVLTEALLLAIDRLELATELLVAFKPIDSIHLLPLAQGLERLAAASADEIPLFAERLIEEVTGFHPASTPSPLASFSSAAPLHPESEDQIVDDLDFFRTLARQFESRSPLFKGRTKRILHLALETNRVAGNKVDAIQLEAAVYMHDAGMMFLAEPVWLKIGKMSATEKAALQQHPRYAAELLRRMPSWKSAATMVEQHHEQPDGTGYPAGLKNKDICDGAKILSIVDAFEAVMLKHSHRGKNKSVLRAIAEANACDNQFAPEWIAPFNEVVRRTLESSR